MTSGLRIWMEVEMTEIFLPFIQRYIDLPPVFGSVNEVDTFLEKVAPEIKMKLFYLQREILFLSIVEEISDSIAVIELIATIQRGALDKLRNQLCSLGVRNTMDKLGRGI